MKLRRKSFRVPGAFGPLVAVVLLASSCTGGSLAASSAAVPTPARAMVPTASGSGSGTAQAAGLKRTSQGGNVTVEVTWEKTAESGDAPLQFKVAMNTHSVDLDGIDLAKQAILRNDSGKEVAPGRWDAPTGGHHRSGTLTFPSSVDGSALIGPQTKFIELIVRDVAGQKERSFKWELAS